LEVERAGGLIEGAAQMVDAALLVAEEEIGERQIQSVGLEA
jgi:hypothetical protein